MILDPTSVLLNLTTQDPIRLDALPREPGIYALHDHLGAIRYVGITADRYGFRGRINSRHVSGSESRSHKFSHAYNTGRMWRAPGDERPDAALAKLLRTAFIRQHCRATFITMPTMLWEELSKLEIAVQAKAPVGMLNWGGRRTFVSLAEPKNLVDTLLDNLRFTHEDRAAIERQAALCPAR